MLQKHSSATEKYGIFLFFAKVIKHNKPGSKCLSPAQFSALWTLQAATGVQDAGCCAIVVLIIILQCIQLAIDILMLASSLMA